MNNTIIESQKQPTKRLGTHCKYGHELKDPNLYYRKTGRTCKLCSIQYSKNYRTFHLEQIKRQTKTYYQEHKTEKLKGSALYYQENKQKIQDYKSDWYLENKSQILKQQKAYRNQIQ